MVSKWETTDELLVNNIGYTKTGFSNWWREGKKGTSPETNDLVNEYLSQEFTNIVPAGKEHLYKTSIAIAELFSSGDLFDGLLYPTISMKGGCKVVGCWR